MTAVWVLLAGLWLFLGALSYARLLRFRLERELPVNRGSLLATLVLWPVLLYEIKRRERWPHRSAPILTRPTEAALADFSHRTCPWWRGTGTCNHVMGDCEGIGEPLCERMEAPRRG